MSRIAVLGLGAMGSRMAVNYADAGHDVTVWNRTGDVATELASTHGLTAAASPLRAASDADFVVSMVSNDDAAAAVWLDDEHGAFASMRPGSTAIESSTLTPDMVRRLHGAAGEVGIRFVEAPVVGSRPQAEAGVLFYLLGGDADAVETARPVIDVNAGNSTRTGDAGTAAVMKLAINGLFAAQVAAYAEIVGFIERSSLDPHDSIATLAALPITSPGLQRILGLIADRDYEPNFPVRLVAKDLGYLTNTSRDLGASTPIMQAAEDVFAAGAVSDARDLDIAGIVQHYRTW